MAREGTPVNGAEASAQQIRVDHVTKSFRTSSGRTVPALADLSVSLKAGEFVCFIGPSGCGKTTLLNMLAGLEFPDGGTIDIAGQPVKGPNPRHAVVFQEYALFPWMTVEGNVGIGLRYQHLPKDARELRVRKLIEFVGLSGFERAFPKELSGGMKQRVALARSYALEPELLLLDEPFGALDAQTKTLLQEDLLRTWEAARSTVVFVTHDVDEAVFLAQRVIVFSRRPGKVFRQFDVSLPYPRTRMVRTSPEFFDLRNEVWNTVYSLVDSESL
jgi:NitT/TauT family transport system ATP-binding protein